MDNDIMAADPACVCGKDADAKAVCKCQTKKPASGIPDLKS